MKNQEINEIGGGSLPQDLENDINERLPELLGPALDYVTKVYTEYGDSLAGEFEKYPAAISHQKNLFLHHVADIFQDLVFEIKNYQQKDDDIPTPPSDEETLNNQIYESIRNNFKRFL